MMSKHQPLPPPPKLPSLSNRDLYLHASACFESSGCPSISASPSDAARVAAPTAVKGGANGTVVPLFRDHSSLLLSPKPRNDGCDTKPKVPGKEGLDTSRETSSWHSSSSPTMLAWAGATATKTMTATIKQPSVGGTMTFPSNTSNTSSTFGEQGKPSTLENASSSSIDSDIQRHYLQSLCYLLQQQQPPAPPPPGAPTIGGLAPHNVNSGMHSTPEHLHLLQTMPRLLPLAVSQANIMTRGGEGQEASCFFPPLYHLQTMFQQPISSDRVSHALQVQGGLWSSSEQQEATTQSLLGNLPAPRLHDLYSKGREILEHDANDTTDQECHEQKLALPQQQEHQDEDTTTTTPRNQIRDLRPQQESSLTTNCGTSSSIAGISSTNAESCPHRFSPFNSASSATTTTAPVPADDTVGQQPAIFWDESQLRQMQQRQQQAFVDLATSQARDQAHAAVLAAAAADYRSPMVVLLQQEHHHFHYQVVVLDQQQQQPHSFSLTTGTILPTTTTTTNAASSMDVIIVQHAGNSSSSRPGGLTARQSQHDRQNCVHQEEQTTAPAQQQQPFTLPPRSQQQDQYTTAHSPSTTQTTQSSNQRGKKDTYILYSLSREQKTKHSEPREPVASDANEDPSQNKLKKRRCSSKSAKHDATTKSSSTVCSHPSSVPVPSQVTAVPTCLQENHRIVVSPKIIEIFDDDDEEKGMDDEKYYSYTDHRDSNVAVMDKAGTYKADKGTKLIRAQTSPKRKPANNSRNKASCFEEIKNPNQWVGGKNKKRKTDSTNDRFPSSGTEDSTTRTATQRLSPNTTSLFSAVTSDSCGTDRESSIQELRKQSGNTIPPSARATRTTNVSRSECPTLQNEHPATESDRRGIPQSYAKTNSSIPRKQRLPLVPSNDNNQNNDVIQDVTDKDILLGVRRGKNFDHPGNRAFFELAQKFHDFYLVAHSNIEKATVTNFLVDAVRKKGGRFLRRCDCQQDLAEGIAYAELTPEEARQRTRDVLIRLCKGKR